MGIIREQSIRSTIYTFIGVVLGFITTGLLFPKFLSTDQNGLLRLLVSYSTLFAQFSGLGINHVTVKYFPYFRNKEKEHSGFLRLPLMISLLGYLLFLILFYVFKPFILQSNIDDSPLFVQYIYYILPLTLGMLFFNSLDTYYRVLYQSTRGTFLREFLQRILIFGSIALLILNLVDFQLFVVLYCSALIAPTLFMIASLIMEGQFFVTKPLKTIEKPMRSEMAKVSFFGLIAGFSTIAVMNIDSIMVHQLTNISLTGIYAITSYFGVLVAIPSRSLLRISSTLISDGFKSNDFETIYSIYYKSCLNQLIIGILLFLGIWLNIDNIFQVLPSAYQEGKYVIFFIGLASLTVMVGGTNGSIIANSKYFSFNAYFAFALIVLTIITNLIFIPIFGITGAAIASLISMLLFNILRYSLILIKFKLQPYNRNHLWAILVGLAVYFVVGFMPEIYNYIIDIILRSLLITILFLGSIFFLNISEDINDLIKKYLRILR